MSTADSSKGTKPTKTGRGSGLVGEMMVLFEKAIDDVDEESLAERVEQMREAQPEAASDDLVEQLVKRKCLQTGAVGAIASGASMVPGLGTLVSLTFGVAAEIGMTFKMQAELVLEIAAVYERKLDPVEKRQVVMLVTGLSAGADQALRKAGEQIAQMASARLAQESLTKAIPLISVAASGGTNILFTYVIGQRALAYFSLGPAAVGDWAESIRAVTGVDERKIVGWLAETTERSYRWVSARALGAADAVTVAGTSVGGVIVLSTEQAGEVVADVGQGIAGRAEAAADVAVGPGEKAGGGVTAAAGKE